MAQALPGVGVAREGRIVTDGGGIVGEEKLSLLHSRQVHSYPASLELAKACRSCICLLTLPSPGSQKCLPGAQQRKHPLSSISPESLEGRWISSFCVLLH